MMKNGSRAITSQKHTLSAAGSCAWVNITRNGPPHITSISPLRSAAAVRAGSGERSSSHIDAFRLVGADGVRGIERRIEQRAKVLREADRHLLPL